MKVWEKIAEMNNGQMQIFIDHCPATIEEKYHVIGEKKFKRHCDIGCGVECVNEYLDIEAKP
jgi:predicted TPR repeat methyltransferase